jgi:putative colanic acid biosynthesis glycosyltransferase WcaI
LNILIHCQVYWPDNTAVSQMITAVAEDTAKAGHSVTVVTSRKGYNQHATYSGSELHHSVNIVRVGGVSLNRHRTVGRILNYLAFVLLSSVRALHCPKPDCLVLTSVPPISLWLGVLFGRLRRVPVVFVIEDLYPDILFASGLLRAQSLPGRALRRMFGGWMRQMTAIIVLGDYMKRRLLASYSQLLHENIYPIHNWHDGDLLHPIAREANRESAVVFQYSGNLGTAHDFAPLLNAADRLRDEEGIQFEFIGRGRHLDFIEREIRERKLSQCRIRDYVPQAELNSSLNQADVCLVTLRPGYEGLIVPSKIYGIMAVGKPALYIGPPSGEIPDLIRHHSIGWVVESGNENQLVEAILEATRQPDVRKSYGANARRAFDAFYERRIATAKYVRVFESCVYGRRVAASSISRHSEHEG